jgi:hypothetical protein
MGHGKFGGKGMMFANLSFEQMARHWFNFLCANPSVESLAHSRSCFCLQAGGLEDIWLIDSGCS